MNVKQSEVKDLTAIITIDIEERDYVEQVDKALQGYRKTALVSGFRKGKVPMGIINKKYRTSVVADEVQKIVQDKLYKHITEQKIRILGSPMPFKRSEVDWINQTEFKFKYEIGLAPEFDVKITNKDKLNIYKIKAGAKLVDKYCLDISKKYGEMRTNKVSKEGDLVFCAINQIDVDGNIIKNGIQNEATVSMDYITNNKIKKQFSGVRINDIIIVNVVKAFANHSDLAAMLNVSHEAIHKLKSEDFQFIVKKISSLEPANINAALFDKVYGKSVVKNLKEFKKRIKLDAEEQFVGESEKMLKNDVVTYFLKKLKLEMPDEFLKRWLIQTSEQPITMEMLKAEYNMYSKSLQWQLIENKILTHYKINVTQEDIIAYTKKLIGIQMKQYGQEAGDDAQLTEIANNILKNEDERKKISDKIFDERTLVVYKENFKLTEKSISYDDFIKLASENN